MQNSPPTEGLSIEEQIEILILKDLPAVSADPAPLGPLQEWELPALRRCAAQLWHTPWYRAEMEKGIVRYLRLYMRSQINLHRPPQT